MKNFSTLVAFTPLLIALVVMDHLLLYNVSNPWLIAFIADQKSFKRQVIVFLFMPERMRVSCQHFVGPEKYILRYQRPMSALYHFSIQQAVGYKSKVKGIAEYFG